MANPAVREALTWPGELVRAHGWEYEVWSGADAVGLENVRFLAGPARPGGALRAPPGGPVTPVAFPNVFLRLDDTGALWVMLRQEVLPSSRVRLGR